MDGVRVLEVAQFTFVPAAGAILADWGADVIKVEHPVRGDTQRGFINMGGKQLDPNRHPLIEHPNRGKRWPARRETVVFTLCAPYPLEPRRNPPKRPRTVRPLVLSNPKYGASNRRRLMTVLSRRSAG